MYVHYMPVNAVIAIYPYVYVYVSNHVWMKITPSKPQETANNFGTIYINYGISIYLNAMQSLKIMKESYSYWNGKITKSYC